MKIVYKNNDLAIKPKIQNLVKVQQQSSYRMRFVVNKGCVSIVLPVASIAYFSVTKNTLFAVDFNQQHYLLNTTMKTLEEELDPAFFFRCNRQFMISISCISCFEEYFNSKLLVKVKPESKEKIIISRQKAMKFKEWVDS